MWVSWLKGVAMLWRPNSARAFALGSFCVHALFGCAGKENPDVHGDPPDIFVTTSPSTTAENPEAGTAGEAQDEDESSSTSAGGSSTTSDSAAETTTATGVRYDVGTPGTTTSGCDLTDICCLDEGEYPPHILLDAFLAAYPPAAMPRGHDPLQSFEPSADGHVMAWSHANVGNEFIDPDNGGVVAENIEAGRDVSRGEAELAVPVGATVVSIRDEPVEIDPPNAGGGCIGTGWAWGSILFEDTDGSIGELVYLYIGHCADDGDAERFFYSDEAQRVCDSVG